VPTSCLRLQGLQTLPSPWLECGVAAPAPEGVREGCRRGALCPQSLPAQPASSHPPCPCAAAAVPYALPALTNAPNPAGLAFVLCWMQDGMAVCVPDKEYNPCAATTCMVGQDCIVEVRLHAGHGRGGPQKAGG